MAKEMEAKNLELYKVQTKILELRDKYADSMDTCRQREIDVLMTSAVELEDEITLLLAKRRRRQPKVDTRCLPGYRMEVKQKIAPKHEGCKIHCTISSEKNESVPEHKLEDYSPIFSPYQPASKAADVDLEKGFPRKACPSEQAAAWFREITRGDDVERPGAAGYIKKFMMSMNPLAAL